MFQIVCDAELLTAEWHEPIFRTTQRFQDHGWQPQAGCRFALLNYHPQPSPEASRIIDVKGRADWLELYFPRCRLRGIKEKSDFSNL